MSRVVPRPPHPFLPPDEDRNAAIAIASRTLASGKVPTKVQLASHDAEFRRIGHTLHVVYTPHHAKNMQTCDIVNVGAPTVGDGRVET